MAIDTARKRASIVSVATPFMPPSIIPDGGFDAGDRQNIAWNYAGILATPPVPPAPEDETLVWFGSRPKSLEPKVEPIKKKVVDDSELLVFFQ